jgi:exonuclease VII small subunit
MDLHKIISELQAEKQRLDEAILALERLSTVASKGKKRGRPPLQKSEHPTAAALPATTK